ncbi:MAG: guanylate kinase [Gammaproteobacteria bacterium]|nr:guanylate kinase [Gammaproteobacteria bacterium]
MTSQKGKLIVISAPSGAGKTSLVKELVHDNPDVVFSVSYTTRSKRDGEVDGRDYHFVSRPEFEKMIEQDEFLEYAQVFDNYYGTAKAQVEKQLERGKNVVLEIDWQGAQQVREAWPGADSVFILPPSRGELERRLRTRATDTDEVINRRLRDAVADMSHWEEFRYVVVNDQFAEALQELQRIVRGRGEQCRADRAELKPLVRSLLARGQGDDAAEDRTSPPGAAPST